MDGTKHIYWAWCKRITCEIYTCSSIYGWGWKVHEENQKYEEDKFGTIALPLYVGMDSNEKVLNQFLGMTRDKEEYKRFLREMLE